ncbi:chemotaxis protein CheA [Aquisalimonas asiatica]|uniref:Chemotaxis protein CheA n=1 Tax=Aquisalimonas asiatica TaxID=406100 RepID=A0A1H8QRC4_9GAMM|nr:chemotaxis protein CheA [Aquisalimonas asiatica]SEO56521.1 two-component system, chemotaxis family, sensor kinase CheA [Aquisalimonas asiatica]
MNPLLKQFVEETREFLEDAASGLLSLEKDPADRDAMDRVFRAMHSTKGGSGLFDFDPMTDLMHEAENLLDEVRQGERPLHGALVDQLLDVLDQVNRWIDAIERDEVLPPDAAGLSQGLVDGLRRAAGDDHAPAADGAAPAAAEEPAPAAAPEPIGWQPEWLAEIPDAQRREAVSAAWQEGAELALFEFQPESGAFFTGGDPLLLVRNVEGLIWLAIEPATPWDDPASMDAYDCRLRFRGLSGSGADTVAAEFAFEDEETLRCERVPADALVFPGGEPGDASMLEEFLASAPELHAAGDQAALRRSAEAMATLVSPEIREGSLLAWLVVALDAGREDHVAALLRQLGVRVDSADTPAAAAGPSTPAPEDAPAVAPAPEPPPAGDQSAPEVSAIDPQALRAVMQEQLAMLAAVDADDETAGGRVAAAGRVLKRALVALGERDDAVDAALESASAGEFGALRAIVQGDDPVTEAAPAGPATEAAGGERLTKSFRVDAESIDLLGDLVGELVVAKNSFPFLAERAEHEYGVRDLARELKERFNVISRIAQDMQGAVMQVQMLPMAQIFQRFPRLVRDLSRRLDKQIELVQEGEQTEADKTVIEVLGEPLTHMVRNSIDHGIESPDVRQAAGKPAKGTIRLTARQEGEHVIVEVEDDGGGLDPEALRRKAVDKALISQAEAERLTDQESLQLIFTPGFSTRDTVSDLSGRGVGMDVVRSTVNRYGGSVSVASEQGRGTRLRLAMPLTMAVSYVMGVEVAGQLFGVPMESVVETVRLPESAVRQVKQEEAVVLRDQVIPLRRLDRLLMLDGAESDRRARVDATYDEPQVTVLVVRQPEGSVGLVVDDFQEGLDVIVKPMEGVLASIRAYSGTALLGDGRVLLVLNLRELL